MAIGMASLFSTTDGYTIRNIVGAPSPTMPMTSAAAQRAGPAVVSSANAQGPMTSMDATISALSRPVLSASTPNSGELATATSMGSVLANPASVASMPSPCKNVGLNDRNEMSTMLNMRNPPSTSNTLRLNRPFMLIFSRGAPSCGRRTLSRKRPPPTGRTNSSMSPPATSAMPAMTHHVPWKPIAPNTVGVSTPPTNEPSENHSAQMPLAKPTFSGAT